MVFEKKLIILSGERNAKGTLTLERNAYGMFAILNLYNLPDLSEGEYCAGLRSGEHFEVRRLGAKGRILDRFAVELADLSAVHCVVFDTSRELALLYGTNTPVKLWQGNMMDGFRRKKDEPKKETAQETEALPSYSGRGSDIRDYFFDILPGERIEVPPAAPESGLPQSQPQEEQLQDAQSRSQERLQDVPQNAGSLVESASSLLESARQLTSEYNDGALAEVNYFEAPVTYSSIEDVDADTLLNPVDRGFREKEPPMLRVQAVQEPHALRVQAAQEPPAPKSLKAAREKSSLYMGEAAFTVPPVSAYSASESASRVRPQTVFYEQIKSQIDGLFATGERFELLENLMDETRWVRVNYDEKRFYAVGLIGSRPDYICYAVPAEFTASAPEELGDNCRWLPETPSVPEGKGFWLMFQDAITGEAL